MRIKFSKKTIIAVSLVSGLVLVSAGSYLQPWKLFTDTKIEEALPLVSDSKEADEENEPEQTTEKVKNDESIDSPEVLAQGIFISHEHATTGAVKILKYVDGTRILRIENLSTSNGPKLEVWLTDAPVIEGLDGWKVFDDGKYVNLGDLKGNIGSQNYVIPTSVNLNDFSSVSIWCERFSVSFGAAALSTP